RTGPHGYRQVAEVQAPQRILERHGAPDQLSELHATSFHWGVGWARTEDGVVQEILPYDADPEPSPIMQGVVDSVTSTMRVARPSVRTGFLENDGGAGRGADRYVEVEWDEAFDLAASHLERIRADHGNQAIFGGSYGWSSAGRFHHAQSQVHRFLNSIGGYTRHVDNYSFAAAMVVIPHVVGDFRAMQRDQNTFASIAKHTELVVGFGGISSRPMQIEQGGVAEHELPGLVRSSARAGVDFVCLSPLRSDMDDELGADWMPLRPGSDVAVMLGLAHTLITEELHDPAFLDRYTVGFEPVRRYVLGLHDGQAKSADWAAQLSGLDAGDIRDLARRMATQRTLVTCAVGVQRAEHGEQPIWMTVVLAALLGQIGLPGQGFGIGYAQSGVIGKPNNWLPWPSLPQGTNGVDAFIPVARIADMLLHPGTASTYNGQDLTYPDIRAVYWAGGNPFHHHQDLQRLTAAFRQPEIVIVNEPFWTGTARHGDIVFPITTPLERNDWGMTRTDRAIVAMSQAIEPVGQARNDFDVFCGLAERMGSLDTYAEGRNETEWLEWLWDRTRNRGHGVGIELPEFADARAAGIIGLQAPANHDQVMYESFRSDPEAHPLATPSGRIELFSEHVASFGYQDCPGHPVWFEPSEWLGATTTAPDELHLISNQPPNRLHSQHDAGSASRATKVGGREPLTMHPDDAAARGLTADALVRVFNDRGALIAGLVIADSVMPGVVQIPTGGTYDPYEHPELGVMCLHGNPNILTQDIGTSSLAQGPSSSTTIVRVEALNVEVPAVRSYSAPLAD
ncbi:UNVERIFIED_CONTAM: hypothetical protein GTU68_043574, partial [Idotea baltica]|nr:hypothetical protein [Idotea baltica]